MRYGINLGSNENYYAAGQIAADDGAAIFAFLKAANVPIVRIDCSYNARTPPYNSGNLACGQDPNIKAALASGCQPLLILDGYTGATSMSAFETFVTNMVAYYGPLGVNLWEVLNEPSAWKNWQITPTNAVSAAGYATLLAAVYPVIKAAVPGATVFAGACGAFITTPASGGSDLALTGYGSVPTVWTLGDDTTHITVDAVDFIKGVYASGTTGGAWTGATPFDAWSMHPYVDPGPPHSGSGYFSEMLTSYQVMTTLGDSAKSIWVTEFGYDNPTPAANPHGSATPDIAAQGLAQAFSIIANQPWPWVGGFLPFMLFDDNTDGNYGYFDGLGNAKPIWGAFQRQVTGNNGSNDRFYINGAGTRSRWSPPPLPEV